MLDLRSKTREFDMAGMASEGTQYDPRQFDTKMNAM